MYGTSCDGRGQDNFSFNPLLYDNRRRQHSNRDVDMQHEVLLALSGYPGNIFTVCRETGLFEVSVHS